MMKSLAIWYVRLYYIIWYIRPDRKGDDAMRKGKKQRLVPLNVMVAPEHLEWIKAQTYGTGDSMGRVVRDLIEANRKLHEAISTIKKGEAS